MKSNNKNQKSKMPPLILASASPRRAQLLREANIPYQVLVSRVREPEHKPKGIPIDLWPMGLACRKAASVRRQIEKQKGAKAKIKNSVILAADTIVVDDSPPVRILNKASDREHARRMLLSLQNKTHRVITGIALLKGERLRLASATATCRVKKFSKAFLEQYLDSGLWRGKAGAYGIQDPHNAAGDPFIELISGEFSTVVGLPMSLVQSELDAISKD